MNTNNALEIDPLAVGLTRPAFFLGAPLHAVIINGMSCTLGYVYTQTVWFFLLFSLFHLVICMLTRQEPYFLLLLWRSLSHTPPVPHFHVWGKINSYGAF